jgi:ABC-type transporter Mla MlaB component
MHSHQWRIKIAMLRITHAQTETEQRWTLCGHLTRPWVAELRACWEHGRRVGVNARTVVDLSDVTFIDESGETLLSEMGSHGAEFIAAGVETKHLLKNLKGKGQRPLRRFIGPPANHCEKCGITKDEGSK